MPIGIMSTGIRSIGAVLLGYAVLVLGALIFQDALFGGLTYQSPPFNLVIGGGMTVVSAVAAGFVLARTAPKHPMFHAVPLVIWLCFETTMLHLSGDSPLWFDIVTGGSNVVGVLIGAYAWVRFKGIPNQSTIST